MEPEKSLPLRPSVVCRPLVVVAMNPVTMSRPTKLGGTSFARFAVLTAHCTAGPNEPHSMMMTSRASIQMTSPGVRWRARKYGANKRVDHISP